MVVVVVVGVVVVVLVAMVAVVRVVVVVVLVAVAIVAVVDEVVMVDLRIFPITADKKKDLFASDVNSGMKILSQGRRHKPKTCLMGMPRNAFRLTPSFVTLACPNIMCIE